MTEPTSKKLIERAGVLLVLIFILPAAGASVVLRPSPGAPPTAVQRLRVASTQQLSPERLQSEMALLNKLAEQRNLAEFEKVVDDLERKWGRQGGESYGQLMLNAASLAVNSFDDEKIYVRSQRYVTQALSKSSTFSLDLETRLLPFLGQDLHSGSSSGVERQKWIKERSDKTRLWLHAWNRLETAINRGFNFDDRPSLNVTPPVESGKPSGVSPEAIKDSRLRARYVASINANKAKAEEYNRQFRLRYIDSIFPKRAEEYLVKAYSKPPDRLTELKSYLTRTRIRNDIRQRVLNRIATNRPG